MFFFFYCIVSVWCRKIMVRLSTLIFAIPGFLGMVTIYFELCMMSCLSHIGKGMVGLSISVVFKKDDELMKMK